MEFLKKHLWKILGAVFLLWGIMWYNGAVTLEESTDSGWGKVQAAYQRRADLIPGLVSVVNNYANHEKEVLTQVTEARSKVGQLNINAENLNAETFKAFNQAQSGLSSALSKLMVVMERYPDLKANQNFLQLQAQLEGTENRINVARSRYTESVAKFNTKIRKFPGVLFNLIVRFDKKPQYESEEGSEKAPDVDALFKR